MQSSILVAAFLHPLLQDHPLQFLQPWQPLLPSLPQQLPVPVQR